MDFFTSFGFRKVSPQEKTHLVQDVFHRVASQYDLMNDLMSLGIHRWWKNCLVEEVSPKPFMEILDMAAGTGDISFRFLKPFEERSLKPSITLCDQNESMLTMAQEKAWDQGITKGLRWVCADAASLPFPSESMDVYTIAFGLRNVTHIPQALQEARRVLKPGGQFFCLEFSHIAIPFLKDLYKTYLLKWIPLVGEKIAQDREAYQYLGESILRFPSQEELCSLLREAGFKRVFYENYTQGVVALHKAS